MEPNRQPQQPDYFGNQTAQPVASPPQVGVVNPASNVPVQPQQQPASQASPIPSPVSHLTPSTPIDDLAQEEVVQQSPDGVIHWIANDSPQYNRGSAWFIVLTLFSISLILLDVFLLKYYSFSAVVLVVFVSLMIGAIRSPRQLNYAFSLEQGLYINNKLYPLDDFSSFGVITDDGQPFIKLIPNKRFGTGLDIYFPEELGEVIVDAFGEFLPMEEIKLDLIDKLTRKLKL